MYVITEMMKIYFHYSLKYWVSLQDFSKDPHFVKPISNLNRAKYHSDPGHVKISLRPPSNKRSLSQEGTNFPLPINSASTSATSAAVEPDTYEANDPSAVEALVAAIQVHKDKTILRNMAITINTNIDMDDEKVNDDADDEYHGAVKDNSDNNHEKNFNDDTDE